MADPKKLLSQKFRSEHRFANFGSILMSAEIKGFRGVDVEINFEYPVTAISGFNGAGKSTVGQVLLCGYKSLSTSMDRRRYYIVNFFPVSIVDPKPFSDDASVTYKYQTDRENHLKDLTVSRAKKEWSGYKRQPERNTEYVGFTVYIPKVERRDFSIYRSNGMSLGKRTDIQGAAKYVSRILGSLYSDVYFQDVKAHKGEGQLGVATRYGASYSENNMGFGEGRVVYTVRLLETCPAQSLIVLEEPETSLHESAQYEFAKYLIDVSLRRGHQIVFSTHSSIMMNALPPEGRKLLIRNEDGVRVYDRASSSRIKTALSAGELGHGIICVEDEFAQSLLREILRRYDKDLLSSVSVIPFGDSKAVSSAKKALEKAKCKAIAVRDADVGEMKQEKLFKLPGRLPPEKEIFHSEIVINKLITTYGIDFKLMTTSNPEIDHHEYSEKISEKANISKEVIEIDCIRAFLDDVGDQWFNDLCCDIKSSFNT